MTGTPAVSTSTQHPQGGGCADIDTPEKDCEPMQTEKPKVDMRHCGHEWCDCGCYGRPHCKIGCGMDRPTPENVETFSEL